MLLIKLVSRPFGRSEAQYLTFSVGGFVIIFAVRDKTTSVDSIVYPQSPIQTLGLRCEVVTGRDLSVFVESEESSSSPGRVGRDRGRKILVRLIDWSSDPGHT